MMSTRLCPKPGKIDQIRVGGLVEDLAITWNPENSRYCVERGGFIIASYKDWRNATRRLRKEAETA